MKYTKELIVTHLVRMKNAGFTSVSKAEIISDLQAIGITICIDVINVLIRDKTLISLKNGKVSLNLHKLRKK